MTANRRILLAALALLLLSVAAAGSYFVYVSRRGLPAQSSDAYEQTTRHFYRGIAGLQVGLTDAARQEFVQATELAPGEPAVWANLGLSYLRLGDFDSATPALARAAALAPASSEIAFLTGRLDTSRGQRDEGIAQLRRAVELDPKNLFARSALVQEIENAGGPNADADAQKELEGLVALQPQNPAVLVERARLAAKRNDAAALKDSVGRLAAFTASWPPEVVERYQALTQTVGEPGADASRAVAFLRNVLARVPSFRESRGLVTPSAELIADPLTRFVRLATPTSTPSPADEGLQFTREEIGTPPPQPWTAAVAVSLDGEQPPVTFVADSLRLQRADGASAPLPLATAASSGPAISVMAVDWNNDFKLDLVTASAAGVRLFIQGEGGAFSDDTPRAAADAAGLAIDASGAWPADIEMDGDLDIVVGVRNAPPVVLRNNGDGTWARVEPFAGVIDVRAFAWGDIDYDGDPDAVFLDGKGALQIALNIQGGQFQAMDASRAATAALSSAVLALALGDVNADGVLDIVTLEGSGNLTRRSVSRDGWSQNVLGRWTAMPAATPASARLFIADIDNNGALDLLATASGGTGVWLAGTGGALEPYSKTVDAEVWGVVDLNADGQLDLVGLAAGRPVLLRGKGTLGYHHQSVRPRAQAVAGDQRINSFGIGGEVEVRSGRFVQKQVISGTTSHFGLGTRTSVDVTRIVWPNGVPQAEFDPAVDRPVVAQQRLKGSCPWIFADSGSGMQFVTDFLWRSPLGLRINAQDTAGVTQTEDWVKIRGNQLAARNGLYDIRITAELWETHFVDHVSMMVVDHPSDVAVFVDERFAREAPALAVHAMRQPVPIARAWDQHGKDVTELVATQDGRHLGTFARGTYQGVAAEHFVEVELAGPIARDAASWLVASGFVYPTDSSINVAIGQGGQVQPRGVSLEALAGDGRWVVVTPDLGFPAGKNKTTLIDLQPVVRAGLGGTRRLRLRTNLEIYWDAIGYAVALSDTSFRTLRLAPASADLRYRGFSRTKFDRRDVPETPIYSELANTAPRWRDLVGYYTRFGDVRALLEKVEDRYVIMNAGDELRLTFTAPPAPAEGWTRDFVLIGDGWVKDGDFNTSFSKTVLPLPVHGRAEYLASSPALELERDGVYQRHPADWETFHTRFVAPDDFLRGLAAIDTGRRP